MQALGKLTGPAIEDEDGWLSRPFKLLQQSNHSQTYQHTSKKWTLRDNCTFLDAMGCLAAPMAPIHSHYPKPHPISGYQLNTNTSG